MFLKFELIFGFVVESYHKVRFAIPIELDESRDVPPHTLPPPDSETNELVDGAPRIGGHHRTRDHFVVRGRPSAFLLYEADN